MPPKGRRQLSGPACDKAAEAYDLIIAFAGQDEELLGETIRALMNCPGVVRALGIPGSSYHDTDAVSSMLAAVRSTFAGRLSTSGSRHAGEREQAQSIAAAMYSPDVSRERAQSLAGIPRKTWQAGATLAAANDAAAPGEQRPTLGIAEHVDHVPWHLVHDWYHTSTALVEIDKQTKRQYKRKNFSLPDGKVIALTCEHRIRFCSAEDLAGAFLESDLHKDLTKQGYSISQRRAQAAICPCIKEVCSTWVFHNLFLNLSTRRHLCSKFYSSPLLEPPSVQYLRSRSKSARAPTVLASAANSTRGRASAADSRKPSHASARSACSARRGSKRPNRHRTSARR